MRPYSFAVGAIVIVLILLQYAMAIEPQDSNKNEQRTIPLSEIVTTGPQDGLQNIKSAMEQESTGQNPETFLRQLHDASRGYSNVFLVDATDLRDALSASFKVLSGSQRIETPPPASKSNPERGQYWLVAYLGAGPSNPTWWTVESVTVEKDKVVLSYRESPPRPATADVRHYYYWIPLGKLDGGAYEIQLFDLEQKAVTLMRRIDVTQREQRGGTR